MENREDVETWWKFAMVVRSFGIVGMSIGSHVAIPTVTLYLYARTTPCATAATAAGGLVINTHRLISLSPYESDPPVPLSLHVLLFSPSSGRLAALAADSAPPARTNFYYPSLSLTPISVLNDPRATTNAPRSSWR